MFENPNMQGKTLCKKCQTWYDSNCKECQFCGEPNHTQVVTVQRVGPTDVDLKLFNLIKRLSEVQKQAMIDYIENSF